MGLLTTSSVAIQPSETPILFFTSSLFFTHGESYLFRPGEVSQYHGDENIKWQLVRVGCNLEKLYVQDGSKQSCFDMIEQT